jgi:1,2-diacylglycerol 3-alpha-glucosyltransferase
VPEKGVFDLLQAYGQLDQNLRAEVGLVFVGDGSSRLVLEEQAQKVPNGMIKFAGFVQRNDLAEYYALAEVLIMPTSSDPWGLVVNEAMACGLPIVVSDVAGCAADLVREDCNGKLIAPGDVIALGRIMQELGNDPVRCRAMGTRSQQYIKQYSPEAWASGVANALLRQQRSV